MESTVVILVRLTHCRMIRLFNQYDRFRLICSPNTLWNFSGITFFSKFREDQLRINFRSSKISCVSDLKSANIFKTASVTLKYYVPIHYYCCMPLNSYESGIKLERKSNCLRTKLDSTHSQSHTDTHKHKTNIYCIYVNEFRTQNH